MKIRVTLLLEVDAERWQEVYPNVESYRQDIRNYVRQVVATSPLADAGAINAAELDGRVR